MNTVDFTRRILPLALYACGAFAEGQVPAPVAPPAQVASGIDNAARQRDLAERLTALESQTQNQGVLTLLNQISELKQEVARLRGQQEELAHQQQIAEKRVKDFYADIDAKLKAMAKAPPGPQAAAVAPPAPPRVEATAPAKAVAPVANDPDAEGKAYEAALSLVKDGNYSAAVKAFQGFVQSYPGAPLVANALYWLGLSQFSLGDFKSASSTQQRLLKEYPQSPKVPDAMVNLARASGQLGEAEASKRWLERVIAEHPGSKAAETARKMQELGK
jgi:tol-pal system protein YbgF